MIQSEQTGDQVFVAIFLGFSTEVLEVREGGHTERYYFTGEEQEG